MELEQILATVRGNMGTVMLAVVALVVLAALFMTISGVRLKRPGTAPLLSADELRFRNVFAMMSEDRRQSLISYYSHKHECGREEAMRRAIEDRARDEGRW